MEQMSQQNAQGKNLNRTLGANNSPLNLEKNYN